LVISKIYRILYYIKQTKGGDLHQTIMTKTNNNSSIQEYTTEDNLRYQLQIKDITISKLVEEIELLNKTIMTNEQKQWLKEHLENDIKMSEYQLRTKETQVRNFEILKRTKNEKYLKLVNDTIPHIKNYIKMSSEILKTL
jgi:hypothetical protein